MFSYEANTHDAVSNNDVILSPQSSVSRSQLELALVRGSVISPAEMADWLRDDLIRKGGPADLSSLSPARKRRRTLNEATTPNDDSEPAAELSLFSNPPAQTLPSTDPLRLPSTSSSSHQPGQISVAAATGRSIRHRRSQPVNTSSSFYHPRHYGSTAASATNPHPTVAPQLSRNSNSSHNSRQSRHAAGSNSQQLFGATSSSSQTSSTNDHSLAAFPPSVAAALFPEALSGPQSSAGGVQTSTPSNSSIYPPAGTVPSNPYAFNASNQMPGMSGASWSAIPTLQYSAAMNPWSFMQPMELHRNGGGPSVSVPSQSAHYESNSLNASSPAVMAALAYSQQQQQQHHAALAAAFSAVSQQQHPSYSFYQPQQHQAQSSQHASPYHYQPPPSYHATTSLNQRPNYPNFDPNTGSSQNCSSRRRGPTSNIASSSTSNDASSNVQSRMPHLVPHNPTPNANLWRQAAHSNTSTTPGIHYNSSSNFLTNSYNQAAVYPHHHQLDFPTLVRFFSLFVHPHETVILNGQPCLRSRVPLTTGSTATTGLSNATLSGAPNSTGLAGAAHHLAAAGTNMETLFHLAAQLENRRRGLSKDELEDLPSWKYKAKEEKLSTDDKEKCDPGSMEEQMKCMVCLEEFESKQTIRMLVCGHEYHSRCVDRWLKNNRTCPMCRADAHDGTHQEEVM